MTILWPGPSLPQLTLDYTLDLLILCTSPNLPKILLLSPDPQPVTLHYLQPN